jgi:glyoxylase-like metal-dependent hydrolase (beta-lactamase superfamily II)
MRIGQTVETLDVAMEFLGSSGATITPALLFGGTDGATLVDTGLPGQLSALEEKLSAAGLSLSSVRRILLTHQDLDHIGGAAALVAATGAEVYAHAADAPYIQGELPLLKLDLKKLEARIAALPADRRAQAIKLLASPPRVTVHHVLEGGEELPFHGGITVIPTPGHTPGHVCYYVKNERLLIAGDALRVENGSLIGPSPMASTDMRRAVSSLRNLLPYRIDAVLCYHGGLARHDIAARLSALARISA